MRRTTDRLRALELAAALLALLPATAAAGRAESGAHRGGVLATGWNGAPADADWQKGVGRGFHLFGESRTEWRFFALRSAADEAIAFHPLWQSFRFSVRDDAPRRRIAFETSVRGGTDLLRGGFRGEVLYAYVEFAPPLQWGQLRLGRQLLPLAGASGFTRMDGVAGRLSIHHLGIEAHAGVPLRSRSFAVPEGGENVTGWGRDWTWGVALVSAGLRTTQFRVGIVDRSKDGELARRHFVVDFGQAILGRARLRSNVAVDLLQRQVQEALVGADLRPANWLRIGIDWEHWQPSFDANELFSVFATDPYDELRGTVGVTPLRWLAARAAIGVQAWPEALSKDNVPFPEAGRASAVERLGLTLRPSAFLSLELDQQLLSGPLGDKLGVSLSSRLRTRDGRIDATLRGDLQRYAYDLQPSLDGPYGGLALDAAVRPLSWIRVGLSGEAIFTPWLQPLFQAGASVEFLFGVKYLRDAGRDAAAGAGGPAAALTELPPSHVFADRVSALPGLAGGVGVPGGAL